MGRGLREKLVVTKVLGRRLPDAFGVDEPLWWRLEFLTPESADPSAGYLGGPWA